MIGGERSGGCGIVGQYLHQASLPHDKWEDIFLREYTSVPALACASLPSRPVIGETGQRCLKHVSLLDVTLLNKGFKPLLQGEKMMWNTITIR